MMSVEDLLALHHPAVCVRCRKTQELSTRCTACNNSYFATVDLPCGNCGRAESKHAEGFCLFAPTKYKRTEDRGKAVEAWVTVAQAEAI